MKKLLTVFLIMIALLSCAYGNAVYDKATAIRIAKEDWYKATGTQMDQKYPLEAYLKDGVWLVTIKLPERMLGGGPTVEIDKKTGKVIRRYSTQ